MAVYYPQPQENKLLIIQPGSLRTRFGLADQKFLPKSVLTATTHEGKTHRYMSNGHVTNWEHLSAQWFGTVFRIGLLNFAPFRLEICTTTDLGIDLEKNNWCLVLSIPICWTREERMRATKIVFEELNFLGLYILEQPAAAAYGYNISTGLIIDIGYDTTVVTPTVDGIIMLSSCKIISAGGRHIEESLKTMLMKDTKFIESIGDEFEKDPCTFTRLVLESDAISADDYTVKNDIEILGKKVAFSEPISKCLDILYDPSLSKENPIDLPYMVQLAVNDSCEIDRRLMVYNNILIVGGCSKIRGMNKRFAKEMVKAISTSETSNELQAREIRFTPPTDYFGVYNDKPEYSMFIGAQIVAKLSFIHNSVNFITKADYDKRGPRVCISDA